MRRAKVKRNVEQMINEYRMMIFSERYFDSAVEKRSEHFDIRNSLIICSTFHRPLSIF